MRSGISFLTTCFTVTTTLSTKGIERSYGLAKQVFLVLSQGGDAGAIAPRVRTDFVGLAR